MASDQPVAFVAVEKADDATNPFPKKAMVVVLRKTTIYILRRPFNLGSPFTPSLLPPDQQPQLAHAFEIPFDQAEAFARRVELEEDFRRIILESEQAFQEYLESARQAIAETGGAIQLSQYDFLQPDGASNWVRWNLIARENGYMFVPATESPSHQTGPSNIRRPTPGM